MMKNVKNVDTVVIDGVRFVKEGAPAATENKMPVVKNCYFSDDRTIVLWDDGTKTVVQCQPGDQFDPEKGIFAAIAKRAYGNTGKFNDVMRTANDMGEYNFIKEMAKNPDAMTKLIEDLFYGLANSDEEDDEDDVCDKSLLSALPERNGWVHIDDIYRLISGHSNYHGDNILAALTCLAEGKKVLKPITVLDTQPKDVVDKNKLVETIKHYMQYPDGLSRLLTIYGGN